MALKLRLRRLEERVRRTAGQHCEAPENLSDLTAEDWLERFAAWGEAGPFAAEVDFPKALAWYRQAVQQARAASDPPFDPPADYLPGLPLRQRRRDWRRGRRYPDVDAAWWWLFEMLRRVAKGKPPVTESEFQALAAWFEANAARLFQREQGLDLGSGRTTSVVAIRCGLARGPRALGVTEVVEELRQIRAQDADRQRPAPLSAAGCAEKGFGA
jgi:hypothetical protein